LSRLVAGFNCFIPDLTTLPCCRRLAPRSCTLWY